MAGVIAALFGGRPRPPDPDPLPGQGGYAMPPGPYGEDGYPGSTPLTRTFAGADPRAAKLDKDRLGGTDNALGGTVTVQSAFRGDQPSPSPRSTPYAEVPQTLVRQQLQAAPGEFYGGPLLRTQPPVNDTAGANPLAQAQAGGGHSVMDTETPAPRRRPVIARDVPGASNVRNQVAQSYKAVPGQLRSYQPAPRGDTAGSSPAQALAGGPVTVPSRFVFAGGGVETYAMQRQMPYAGRGDGARGADLNGTRYYATWSGSREFANAAAGAVGTHRAEGPNHRPVMFAQPAPWSANYYDTTASVGTPDSPGTGGQSPDMVYISPQAGRAPSRTGRTG